MSPEEALAKIAAHCDEEENLTVSPVPKRTRTFRAFEVGPGAVPDHDALEAIADLHLTTGAGWTDDGREGFIAKVRAILAGGPLMAPDRAALIDLLREETGWDWAGEQDEPAPIFGCDTRVPSSQQALEAFADRILALLPSAPATLDRDAREAAWQAWKAREARYRDSSMTDLRQAFEGGWDALEGCVRTTPGVHLTPGTRDARVVRSALRYYAGQAWGGRTRTGERPRGSA